MQFLRDWLKGAENVSLTWPGSMIYAQIQDVLADGVITSDERAHLQDTLQKLVGGTLDDLADSTHVSSLALDEPIVVDVEQRSFCFTGDFVFGPRSTCEIAVTRRSGSVAASVTKKLNYLVVGGLGSAEWKHGSFGTKIEKAMQYKSEGVQLLVIHEDLWANALRG